MVYVMDLDEYTPMISTKTFIGAKKKALWYCENYNPKVKVIDQRNGNTIFCL